MSIRLTISYLVVLLQHAIFSFLPKSLTSSSKAIKLSIPTFPRLLIQLITFFKKNILDHLGFGIPLPTVLAEFLCSQQIFVRLGQRNIFIVESLLFPFKNSSRCFTLLPSFFSVCRKSISSILVHSKILIFTDEIKLFSQVS